MASKDWTYVDIYENEPPPPPTSIHVQPQTLNKKIFISWLKPSNSQRDIKSYRIWRRNALGQPWTLLKEILELDINSDGYLDVNTNSAFYVRSTKNLKNFFIDANVSMGNKYIYALTCVDIHGIQSFMSTQIQAELNPKFNIEKQERAVKWISRRRYETQ